MQRYINEQGTIVYGMQNGPHSSEDAQFIDKMAGEPVYLHSEFNSNAKNRHDYDNSYIQCDFKDGSNVTIPKNNFLVITKSQKFSVIPTEQFEQTYTPVNATKSDNHQFSAMTDKEFADKYIEIDKSYKKGLNVSSEQLYHQSCGFKDDKRIPLGYAFVANINDYDDLDIKKPKWHKPSYIMMVTETNEPFKRPDHILHIYDQKRNHIKDIKQMSSEFIGTRTQKINMLTESIDISDDWNDYKKISDVQGTDVKLDMSDLSSSDEITK